MSSTDSAERIGLVVVLTGGGKGKSTAALGIALRAAGHGMRVCLVEFMKSGECAGELKSLSQLPEVELHIMGKGFCGIAGDDQPATEHRHAAQEAFRLAKEKISSAHYDVVILDEINVALALGLLELHQVLSLINERPPLLHVILTGREAHPDVIERAHTVTEMHEIKHAFRQGIAPQQGIDY